MSYYVNKGGPGAQYLSYEMPFCGNTNNSISFYCAGVLWLAKGDLTRAHLCAN